MSAENVTLTDAGTGSRASILAGFGFNCYEFRVPLGGADIDVLWSAPGFEQGCERASGSGIPLLFPFPGRIPGTTFRWAGREFELTAGDGRGNAIHGFVLDRPWRVLEQTASRVVAEFHASRDDARLLTQWPADFRIRGTYELVGYRLSASFVMDNPSDQPLPCGFGTHPYFRLPVGGAAAANCVVRLPVTRRWELAEMLPTGKCLELEDSRQFQAGQRFEAMRFDDVFSGLVFNAGRCRSEIRDPASGVTVAQDFDASFRECVVYTPPHREAICIEPYTCVAGAFGVAGRERELGVRLLGPGESFTSDVVIEVAASQT